MYSPDCIKSVFWGTSKQITYLQITDWYISGLKWKFILKFLVYNVSITLGRKY